LFAELKRPAGLPEVREAQGVARQARGRHVLAAGAESVNIFVQELLGPAPFLALGRLAARFEQFFLRVLPELHGCLPPQRAWMGILGEPRATPRRTHGT